MPFTAKIDYTKQICEMQEGPPGPDELAVVISAGELVK